MAGRERDWMDYAQLASSAAQNAQLSSLGDQLAALKKVEFQKQLADFEVTVIRQILLRIEDRIRFFTKQASYSPQGKLLALRKLAEALESFNDPSFYRNYEDKDRHSALTAKVDEAVMQIEQSLPPAGLAEFNEAVAWQKKLPLLAQSMQLSRDTEAYLKQTERWLRSKEKRLRFEAEYPKKKAEWLAARDAVMPQLAPLEKELKQIQSQLTDTKSRNCVLFVVGLMSFFGVIALLSGPEPGAKGAILGAFLLGLAGWGMSAPTRAAKVRPTLRKNAVAIERKIAAILPPEPRLPPEPQESHLAPTPRKPSNEEAERFLVEEKLGSNFPELDATFTEKRALVERVLEADTGLEKDLSELEARTLLQRTTQEVAAKMGLPLPPMTLPKPPKASSGVSVEVQRLAKQPGQKSAAVRLHIEQTGVGLAEAMAAVKALQD